MSSTDIGALLAERGKVHGDFSDHARITSRLKDIVIEEVKRRQDRRQPALTLCMRESLDMIFHKIGRILAGKADYQDHWDDIAGYAKLVSERCGTEVAWKQVLDRVDQVAPPACPDLDQEYSLHEPRPPRPPRPPRNYGNSGSVSNSLVTGIKVEGAEPETLPAA